MTGEQPSCGAVDAMGGTVTETHTDAAISAASIIRPGPQAMLQAATMGRLDTICAEALDRLSRDAEHIAGMHKRPSFASVRITTLSEGAVDHLHIGLEGTMNALFLKDLADKTRRGLRGRVGAGKHPDGAQIT